jgi:hypothetical protein
MVGCQQREIVCSQRADGTFHHRSRDFQHVLALIRST